MPRTKNIQEDGKTTFNTADFTICIYVFLVSYMNLNLHADALLLRRMQMNFRHHKIQNYLDIFLHLLLEDGEEDAASEQVAEVGRNVEGEKPRGAADAQPALDPVTPGSCAAQRGVIPLLLPIWVVTKGFFRDDVEYTLENLCETFPIAITSHNKINKFSFTLVSSSSSFFRQEDQSVELCQLPPSTNTTTLR